MYTSLHRPHRKDEVDLWTLSLNTEVFWPHCLQKCEDGEVKIPDEEKLWFERGESSCGGGLKYRLYDLQHRYNSVIRSRGQQVCENANAVTPPSISSHLWYCKRIVMIVFDPGSTRRVSNVSCCTQRAIKDSFNARRKPWLSSVLFVSHWQNGRQSRAFSCR